MLAGNNGRAAGQPPAYNFWQNPLAGLQAPRRTPSPRTSGYIDRKAVYAQIENKMVQTEAMPPRNAPSPLPQHRYAVLATLQQEARYLRARALLGFHARWMAMQRAQAIDSLRVGQPAARPAASGMTAKPDTEFYEYRGDIDRDGAAWMR